MILAKKTLTERIKRAKINRRKRLKRERIIQKPWNDLTFKEKAKFIAKWEWDNTKRTYVRRENPGNVMAIEKDLKKKAKRMARQGSRISKLGRRVKRVQLATADYEDLGVMFLNLSAHTDPDTALASLLAKTKKDKISGEAYSEIKKYFTDPETVQAYKTNKSKLILITEGFGWYTIIAKKDYLKKLKKGLESIAKNEGMELDAEIVPINQMGKNFLSVLDKLNF